MKLKELAEKYGVDLTELSCAVSVAVGRELTAEDDVEITPEVIASVRDFLGIDLSQEEGSKDSEKNKGERGETKEELSSLDQGTTSEEAEESGAGVEEEMNTLGEGQEQSESDQKTEEEGGGEDRQGETDQGDDLIKKGKEELSVEKDREESEDEKDKRHREDSDQDSERHITEESDEINVEKKEEIFGEDIGGTAESGQEKGSPHQEAVQEGSRGDAEEAVQEEEGTEEETSGGDEVNVPEGVGDERSILLGDSAPPSSQSTAEEKISLDKVKIKEEVVSPQEDIPVPTQEKTTEEMSAVPVETVESSEQDVGKESSFVNLPGYFVYLLLGLAGISVLLLSIGVYKILSMDKHSEKKEPISVSVSSDAELFAVLFRMVTKGNYSWAQDLFEELKDRFPHSKFLDDASIYLGDAFFESRVDLPDEERYKEALKYYTFAYKISSRSLTKEKALLRMGHCYYRIGDYDSAIDRYRTFLKEFYFSKSVGESRYYLGLALLKAGHPDEAEEELKELIKMDKESKYRPLAIYQLVKYYFANKNWKKVVEVSNLFIHDYPTHNRLSEVLFMYADALIALGRVEDAIRSYEEAERYLPKDLLPKLYFRKAEAYEKKGDIPSAIDTYLKMAEEFKYSELSPVALYRAGELLKEEGKLKEAVNVLYELKERFYKWNRLPEVFFLLSQVFARQGRFGDAERWLREIVKRFPDYQKKEIVYWYLARMLELQGKYKDAVRVYDKLLQVIPKDEKSVRLRIFLAKADALMRARLYSKAIGVFASVLSEFKNYPRLNKGKILYRLSIAYFYNGDYPKAIESFRDAIKISPLSPWRFRCRYMLGRTYEVIGEIQEAMDQYLRIVNNRFLGDRTLKSLAWESLGRIYLRLGKYGNAFSAFKQARAMCTDWWRSTDLLRLQASALTGEKDFDSALKIYAKYLARLLSAYDARVEEKNGEFSLSIGRDSQEAFEKIVSALIKIGDTHYRAGNYRKAIRVYGKVKQVYEQRGLKVPDWVLYQIGMCYKMMKDWEKAVIFFDKVISEYPESIWAKEAGWQKNEMQIREKLNRAKQILEMVER